jgi:hypothetical protein
LAAADHMRLMEYRSEFLKELNEDISTVMTMDIGYIEMTNSEISGLNDFDNSIFDKEIPEILGEMGKTDDFNFPEKLDQTGLELETTMFKSNFFLTD